MIDCIGKEFSLCRFRLKVQGSGNAFEWISCRISKCYSLFSDPAQPTHNNVSSAKVVGKIFQRKMLKVIDFTSKVLKSLAQSWEKVRKKSMTVKNLNILFKKLVKFK